MIDLPRVTSDRICCPVCSQRVGYRNDGLPVPHWHADDTQCPAMWPPYVAGAPQPARRRPITHPLRRKK